MPPEFLCPPGLESASAFYGRPDRVPRRRGGSISGGASPLIASHCSSRHNDFAGLRAVVLADDAVFGHEVDQPRRAAVADAQRPLQQRDAAAAFADDDVDRRLVQFVAAAQLLGRAPSPLGRSSAAPVP